MTEEGRLDHPRRVKTRETARKDERDVRGEFAAIKNYLAGRKGEIAVAGAVVDDRAHEGESEIIDERRVLCIAPATPIDIPDETQIEAGIDPLNEFMARVQEELRWNTGLALERREAEVLPDGSLRAPMLIFRKTGLPIADLDELKTSGGDAPGRPLVKEICVAGFPTADFARMFRSVYANRGPTDIIPPEFFVPVRK